MPKRWRTLISDKAPCHFHSLLSLRRKMMTSGKSMSDVSLTRDLTADLGDSWISLWPLLLLTARFAFPPAKLCPALCSSTRATSSSGDEATMGCKGHVGRGSAQQETGSSGTQTSRPHGLAGRRPSTSAVLGTEALPEPLRSQGVPRRRTQTMCGHA